MYCGLTLCVQGKSDLELERAQLKEVSERLKREEAEVSQLRHELKVSQGQVLDDERMHVFRTGLHLRALRYTCTDMLHVCLFASML